MGDGRYRRQGQQFAVGMANSEGWVQAGELGLALLLSAVIGLEREMRQKARGATTANGSHQLLSGELDQSASEWPMVEVTLQVPGRGLVNELAAGLSELPAVKAVVAEDVHTAGE